ncbi:hypothetical protein TpMuguga_03g00319 [Theileria parva strain Muguga]|uniref:Uncharacterized protein n=1 Tax=Theileria parva TaxID=5875 RepID=Q4N035_THEPA|nr:uncharacterized protein TpMuguga_03g00319 [Theileria parva strain Muguga]EAN31054.1 hypothetical protein TpMuguga_03g00319 [Theileria parva strain Muguga]|eukprot:XP_763337.1 hypothetical protein [Theileria parva strain Muguga]
MMKFVVFTLLALFIPGLDAAAGKLNLKELGFALYGKHGEGTTAGKSTCPLGALPDSVFLHKTFKKGDAFFTWVRPVHNKVNEVVCGDHEVWKAADGEVLLDLHFVGKPTAADKKFVHLELLHKLGGVFHVFLLFDGTAAAKVVGMSRFVAGVHGLVPELHSLEGLPAHHLVHELALHAAAA